MFLRKCIACVCLCLLSIEFTSAQCIFEPDDVIPFCTEDNELGITYPANTSGKIDIENAIGCFESGGAYSGAWFIMQIDNPGDLGIMMTHSANSDLDFLCFGPFQGATKNEVLSYVCAHQRSLFYRPPTTEYTNDLLNRMSSNGCYSSNSDVNSQVVYDINSECFRGKFDEYPINGIADCSASHFSTELCYLPDTKSGEWYLLYIANWGKLAGDINFRKTGGDATTFCGIIVDAYSTGPYCEGSDIQLGVNNAPATATFLWSGPNGFSSSEKNPVIPNATVKNAGNYTVVMYNNGYEAPEVTVPVEVYKADTTIFNKSVDLAPDESFSFNGKSFNRSGKYEFPYVNVHGCDSLVILNLRVNTMSPNLVAPASLCMGETLVAEVTGVPSDVTYSWSGPDNFESNKSNIKITGVSLENSGLYSVRIQTEFSDTTLSANVEVLRPDTVMVEDSIFNDSFCRLGESLYNESGTYSEMFTNQYGCDSLVILNLKVLPARAIVPATYFTPDHNGITDTWQIENIESYPEAVVSIFDRWGKRIFHSDHYNNLTNAWNGTYNGSKMPSTDYWYLIDIESIDRQMQGHFTLIR